MARRTKPGIGRKIVAIPGKLVAIPSYVMRNKWKSAKTATKLAVFGTALLAAALYAYTTFSPRYENGDQQRTGIEKITSDAENIFSDAKNIADYVRNEFQPKESYKE